jgi:hypothetical protein
MLHRYDHGMAYKDGSITSGWDRTVHMLMLAFSYDNCEGMLGRFESFEIGILIIFITVLKHRKAKQKLKGKAAKRNRRSSIGVSGLDYCCFGTGND